MVNPQRVHMSLGLQAIPRLEQRLKLASAIAPAAEDAVVMSHKKPEIKAISPGVLQSIHLYIVSEDSDRPYNDRQILEYMHGQGFQDLERRDVTRARNMLNIPPSYTRHD